MAKNKHRDSKIFLTAVSLLAFGGISGYVSMHGPFGKSATTTTQAASVQSAISDDDLTIQDDGGQNISISNGQIYNVSNSGPVARSQGS